MRKRVLLSPEQFLFLHDEIICVFDDFLRKETSYSSSKELPSYQLYGYSDAFDDTKPSIVSHMKTIAAKKTALSKYAIDDVKGRYLYNRYKDAENGKSYSVTNESNKYVQLFFAYVGVSGVDDFINRFNSQRKFVDQQNEWWVFDGFVYFHRTFEDRGVYPYVLKVEMKEEQKELRAELSYIYADKNISRQYRRYEGIATIRESYITINLENVKDSRQYYSLILYCGFQLYIQDLWKGVLSVISKDSTIVSGEAVFLKRKDHEMVNDDEITKIKQYLSLKHATIRSESAFAVGDLSLKKGELFEFRLLEGNYQSLNYNIDLTKLKTYQFTVDENLKANFYSSTRKHVCHLRFHNSNLFISMYGQEGKYLQAPILFILDTTFLRKEGILFGSHLMTSIGGGEPMNQKVIFVRTDKKEEDLLRVENIIAEKELLEEDFRYEAIIPYLKDEITGHQFIEKIFEIRKRQQS